MFFRKPLNKRIAEEKITESLLVCETSGDYSYTLGLVDMAWELGIISLNERAEFGRNAADKYQTAKKNKTKRG